MAEYKRKRRSAFRPAPKINKKKIKREKIFDDEVTSSKMREHTEEKPMKVVRGKKFKVQRRVKATAIALSIIAVILIICQILMPAGVVETVSNWLAPIGSGSYPISLESSETINVVYKGSYYYLLTNNSIEAYSTGGKKILSHSHGFENPVLKTSGTRALVFSQDGNTALIFTLQGLKATVETEEKIKTAAIGDDGTYALVTSSPNYAAQINVYEKNGEKIYEWYSAKDLVNNVALAPSGKKMAVTTFNSAVGTYDSKLSILNFESATPESEKIYQNTLIYALDTSFGGGFSVLTANEYNYIDWSDFEINKYTNEYNTAMFRAGNDGIAVVYNRENDKTDNRIAIFSKSGKLKKELQFKGVITDFALKNQHIYCVSDTKAYILDDDGSFMRTAECGFGVVRICPVGQNAMALITDNRIEEIEL